MHGSAVLALLAVFALLFLVHVPARTTYLTARNFRLLADSGDQIKIALGTLYTSLTNAASEALDVRKGDAVWGTAKVGRALSNVVPKLQIVRPPELEPSTDLLRNVTISVRRDLENTWLHYNYVEAVPPMQFQESSTNSVTANVTSSAQVAVAGSPPAVATGSPPAGVANAPAASTRSVGLSQGTLRFEVQTDFHQFIQRLLSRHEFDEVFLAKEDGEVLFQAEGGEIRVTRLPFAADAGNDTNRIAVTGATLRDLSLSGADYRAFAQPLYFALPNAAGETNALVKWVLSGLVKRKNFRSQTLSVSYTLVILSVFAVTLSLLSWPFLNVVLAGPREELKVFAAFTAVAASFLTCGALALLLLDCNAYPRLQETMDDQLQVFSRRISTNLLQELSAVNRQLLSFDEQLRRRADKQTNRVHVFTNEEAIYPHLRMAVWANAGGRQLYKWSAGPAVTPFVSIGDRDYFRQITENRAWPLDLPPTNPFFDFRNNFGLEPIYSRTRGENVAIFSIKSSQPDLQGSNQPVVAYAEFRPLSLVQPVVPAGYGFCVINADGRVVFHSEERRNLRENFTAECEDDPRLRAAIQSRTADDFTTRYFRRAHHLYVAPLPGFPWTLVTFRDKSLLSNARAEMLSLSVILYGFYTLLMVGGLALVYLTHSRRHPIWVWPDFERSGGYQWIIACNLLVAVLFAAGWLVFSSTVALLAQAVLLPTIAVVVAYRILKAREPFRRDAWRWFLLVRLWLHRKLDDARIEACKAAGRSLDETSFSTSRRVRVLARLSLAAKRLPWPLKFGPAYVTAFGSLLAVVALLPAVGFYRIGFAQESERFVKFAQLKLAQNLRDRTERVRSEARNRLFPDRTNLVRFRLDGRWDRYDGIFLGTELSLRTNEPSARPAASAEGADRHLLALRPHFSEVDEATAGLVFGAAADGSWRSRRHDNGRLSLFVTGRSSEGDPAGMEIVSRLLALSWPPCVGFGVLWYAGLALVLVAPFFLARVLARRVFLLHLRSPAAEEFGLPEIEASGHLRLPGLRLAREGEDAAKNAFIAVEATHFHFLDLKLPADRAALARPRRHGVESDAVVVLVNSSCLSDEPDFEAKKAGWLKALAKDHAKTLVVLSPSGPQDMPAPPGRASRLALAQEASRCHHALWEACLPLEQLTLLQVARTGLVNSERLELRTLLARGLLQRDPELRLVNESFRRFVLAKGSPDTPPPEETDGSMANWQNTKGALWVLLTGVAAFLFLTQREVWNILIGVATAFMAGLNSLTQASKVFKGDKKGGGE